MKRLVVAITQMLILVGLLVFLHGSGTIAQSTRTPTVDSRLKAIEDATAEMRREVSELKASNAALVAQVNMLSSMLGVSSTLTVTTVAAQDTTPVVAENNKTNESDERTSDSDGSTAFEILSVDAKIIESNNVWWKMAWVLEIKSTSDSTLNLTAKIEFVDEDDFVIHEDYEYGIRVRPGETVKVNGYSLVDSGIAPDVAGINAEVFE